jgi:tetratricopeptide (TPR) repeat protein
LHLDQAEDDNNYPRAFIEGVQEDFRAATHTCNIPCAMRSETRFRFWFRSLMRWKLPKPYKATLSSTTQYTATNLNKEEYPTQPRTKMRLPLYLTIPILLLACPGLAQRSAAEITTDANRLLAEGSYLEAARAYGEAIGTLLMSSTQFPGDSLLMRVELEPTYSNYYKRATAYLSLGRNGPALDDFETILKLNPSFVQVSCSIC